MITVNARSLRPQLKRDVLKKLIIENDPHIVVVVETWWDQADEPKIHPNYIGVLTDPKGSRGVAVLYKPQFNIKQCLRVGDRSIVMSLQQD